MSDIKWPMAVGNEQYEEVLNCPRCGCNNIHLNGVNNNVPPRKLFAFPMEDTVISSAWPGRAKAGSIAVTITAATFFS